MVTGQASGPNGWPRVPGKSRYVFAKSASKFFKTRLIWNHFQLMVKFIENDYAASIMIFQGLVKIVSFLVSFPSLQHVVKKTLMRVPIMSIPSIKVLFRYLNAIICI